MKIRIKGNTLRFRLTKSEVEYFGKEGFLEEKINFQGASSLSYRIQIKNNLENLTAEFADKTITMFVPQHLAEQWTTTELVGFEREMETGEGRKLYLLLEKDYKCLDQVSEDQSDNYENPLMNKKF